MTEVGQVERVTLVVAPFDGTTDVTLTLRGPDGQSVALVEPVGLVGLTHDAWDAVVQYDRSGLWLGEWVVTGTGASGPRYFWVAVSEVPTVKLWPPSLTAMKDELKRPQADTIDDVRMLRDLDAAIEFVQRVRGSSYNFGVSDESGVGELPDPGRDLVLGTLRLAIRWFTRGRSPDGIIDMGELGSARVPSFDVDIDRLLGIGRFRSPVIA